MSMTFGTNVLPDSNDTRTLGDDSHRWVVKGYVPDEQAGIVQKTDTATQNIAAGKYVIWKGELYIASSAIASGATLSSSNLTAVSNGVANLVDEENTTATGNGMTAYCHRVGKIATIYLINGQPSSEISAGTTLFTVPEGYRPAHTVVAVGYHNGYDNYITCILSTSGTFVTRTNLTKNKNTTVTMTYTIV